jgi:hypothetical protein
MLLPVGSVVEAGEWHVPHTVHQLRIAVIAAPPSEPRDQLLASAAPLRASTTVLRADTDPVDSIVAGFRRLVQDGCDPQQVCIIGVGAHAAAALAAALLLRLHGETCPFAVAAVTATARLVLRLEGASVDELVRHLAEVRPASDDCSADSSLRSAAVELDRLLSAGDC